jgi:K+-sensing histidine kinase KdpD
MAGGEPRLTRRWVAGYAVAAVLAALLTVLLAISHRQLNPVTDVLAFVIAVIAVALLGGLAPAVFEAITGSLLLNFRLLPPAHTFTIAVANDATSLSVLIAVAVVFSLQAGKAVRHAEQAAAAIAAAEPIAEADRMRTALLAAVSHDLRTPLAAAKAAVSCLRCRDIQLRRRITANSWPPPMSPWTGSASWSPACWTRAGCRPVRCQCSPAGRSRGDRRALTRRHGAAGPPGRGKRATRTAPGHGRSSDHGKGHSERDRERAAVLTRRIAATAGGMRSGRPG